MKKIYYDNLSEPLKLLSKKIKSSFLERKQFIDFTQEEMSLLENERNFFTYIFLENPDLYFVNPLSINNNQIINGKLFLDDAYNDYLKEDELEKFVNNLKIKTATLSDYEKIVYVHEIISKNTFYDYQAYSKTTNDNYCAFNLIGVFLNHKAVCQGVSSFVSFLLDSLDIENSILMCERKGVSHSCNLIYFYENGKKKEMIVDVSIDLKTEEHSFMRNNIKCYSNYHAGIGIPYDDFLSEVKCDYLSKISDDEKILLSNITNNYYYRNKLYFRTMSEVFLKISKLCNYHKPLEFYIDVKDKPSDVTSMILNNLFKHGIKVVGGTYYYRHIFIFIGGDLYE